MASKNLSKLVRPTLVVMLAALFVPLTWAGSITVVYNFTGMPDGVGPLSALIFDASGNLYGTTWGGGENGTGTVYKLTHNPGGTWTENVLYSFTGGADGKNPQSRLVFDAQGNLYGSTVFGGRDDCILGCGTIFELSPNQDGTWSETTIYWFGGGSDGDGGANPLVLGGSGELYGTTTNGGAYDFGSVFVLTDEAGNWTKSTIYSFTGGVDGRSPLGALTIDAAGNLYGTTNQAGMKGGGTAFELSPNPDGTWTGKLLHTFSGGLDGSAPVAGLLFDAAGDLYGTTTSGGRYVAGTVFRLEHVPDAGWKETILHAFRGAQSGSIPEGDLAFDAHGNLYGTTDYGGLYTYAGTAFVLHRRLKGGITFKEFSFNGHDDGSQPVGGVVADATGKHLYGTTTAGGMAADGTVFEITP